MAEPTTEPAMDVLDAIDAELCRRRPDWTPLTDEAKAAIRASVAAAPPMSLEQCARVGKLLGL